MADRLLTLADLLSVAGRTLGDFVVRDIGRLDVATARPQSTVFGEDAYPSLKVRVAALVHSVAGSHAWSTATGGSP